MTPIFYLYNILFFILIGMLEGVMWNYAVNKISKTASRNLHISLVVVRLSWFVWLFYMSDYDLASVSSLILCYPFWHLGMMYKVSNMFNDQVYKRGFLDTASSTSTSVIERFFPQTFFIRSMMFIIGTAFFFLWNL
jgi:hypothetical protein